MKVHLKIEIVKIYMATLLAQEFWAATDWRRWNKRQIKAMRWKMDMTLCLDVHF